MSHPIKTPDGRLTGTGRRLRLRETMTPAEKVLYNNPLVKFNPKSLADITKRMLEDPVYAATIQHELRRPRKVDRVRHAIAGRAAAKEPMLNASPDSILNGLNYHEPNVKDRLTKTGIYKELVVKPLCMANAKLEHAGTFWGERRWCVHTLKWHKGFVIVTDRGSESSIFQTYGELRAAILKSGWEIVN